MESNQQKSSRTFVEVRTIDDTTYVRCPFNFGFIKGAKSLAGRWDSSTGQWTFSKRTENLVRTLCIKWFATDGVQSAELVDIHLTFPTGNAAYQGPITAFGRVLATAKGRDSRATIGDGIALIGGRVSGGGSVKNWQTVATPGTTFLILDIPRALLSSELPAHSEFEIVNATGEPCSSDALRMERARLLDRIQEINNLLQQDA